MPGKLNFNREDLCPGGGGGGYDQDFTVVFTSSVLRRKEKFYPILVLQVAAVKAFLLCSTNPERILIFVFFFHKLS